MVLLFEVKVTREETAMEVAGRSPVVIENGKRRGCVRWHRKALAHRPVCNYGRYLCMYDRPRKVRGSLPVCYVWYLTYDITVHD
jgi:hypothetical protein